ncbi:MAG: autotransporter-associated beta strand repeat-containing protein [Limisphaerales bacterium]
MTKTTLLSFQSAAIFPQSIARLKTHLRLGIAALASCACLATAPAETVTLLSSDVAGTSSLNSAGNWSNGQAPNLANDYFVPKSTGNPNVDYIVRTPTSGTVTFAGNSLTVEGYIAFKGTNFVTINDLRLTNGLVGNYSTGGNPATGRLRGNINIITNGVFYAGGSGLNMQIFSIVSGSGGLEIRQPNKVTLSATNTYNGPVTLVGSTLELDGTGSLWPSSLTLQNYTSGTSRFPNSTNIVLPGGHLNVGYGPSGVLRVGYRTSGAGSTNSLGVLNVSSQPSFTVNVGEFSVGNNITSLSNLYAVGYVYLATNNDVTATNIFIGDNGVSGSSGATSTIALGAGSNYFNTPLLQVSARKESGLLTLPAGGVFRLDNGAGRTTLTVGGENLGTSVSPTGTMNLSGGTFLASLDTLTIGMKAGGNSGGDTGTLTVGTNALNNINVNSVVIGSMAGAESGSPVGKGTLTFGGGTFLVNNDVTLGSYDNNGVGSASGTLNINGGTFSVAGNIVDGGGTSTLNVNGGVLDMQPAGDGTPGSITVDVLSGGGTIVNASALTVSGLIAPGGTNTPGTLTVGSLDLSSGTPLNFDLGSNLTIGGGVNDLLQVNGDLTLNGNTITVTALAPLSTGTYRLINYTGTLSGNTSLTLIAPSTRQTFTLDLSTPGQVNLIVSGNPISLLWSGDGGGNVWDTGSTANWNAGADVYYDGDHVTFNDSGSAVPDINVALPVQPGSMTVDNSSQAYIFDGSPISTPGSLVKRGNNTLALANDGNNFSGPISIEAGTLSIGNGGSAGSLGSGAITNNGELLMNKSSGGAAFNSPISGSGSLRLTGGDSSLALGGTNSYTGLTTIENGEQLNILNNSALGSTNAGTIVQYGGSVRFTSAGNWTVGEPLEINGYGIPSSAGALYANTTSNNVTWTGPITVASPAQIRDVNTGVRMTLAGPVTADNQALQATANDVSCLLTFQNLLSLGTDPSLAVFTKDGAGNVVLAGATNIAGSTIINAGSLVVATTNAPQLGDITVNGGALQIGSGAADGSLPTGQINLAGSAGKLAFNSSNTFVLNNPLTGPGSLSLLNYSTVIISNANPSFSGNVTTGQRHADLRRHYQVVRQPGTWRWFCGQDHHADSCKRAIAGRPGCSVRHFVPDQRRHFER